MRWLILAACVLARLGIGLQFIAIAALMPAIRADLGLSYTQVGLLLGLFMVTGVFLAVPSGMIAGRWGDRRTLFVGLGALTVAAGLQAGAESFAVLLAGRVLGGLGAVFVTVTAAKILTDWFLGREISTAMGFLGLSWPLGIALGLSLLPSLAAIWGWRGAVLAMAALPLLAAAAVLALPRLGRAPDGTPGAPRDPPPLWSITWRELLAVVVGGIAWPLMSSGGYVVFSSYAAEYMTSRGFGHAQAGLALGLMSWLFLLTIPLGGWLADRLDRGDRLFWIGCWLSALTIAAVPLGGPIVLWVALTAIMGITVGPIMALPGALLSPASRATGLGVYYAIYYLGTVILPALAGWLLDVTGRSDWVVWFAAVCLLVAPLFLTWCRALQRRWTLGG